MSSFIRKSLSAAGLLIAAGLTAWGVSAAVLSRETQTEAAATGGAAGQPEKQEADQRSELRFPVTIHCPAGPPRVDSGARDLHGQVVTIACSTCHTTREPNPRNRVTADLDQFHQGLHAAHGGLSCLACHNPDDYDSLRLADGTRLEYGDVMNLCAQCHGPQARDYHRGAHGGMTGYWDLSRGPRQRNSCIDCHDPHAPAYPRVAPVFPPRDGVPPKAEGHHGDTAEESDK